jgi:hypothetical protein
MSRPRERGSVETCHVLDVNKLNRRGHLPKPPADEAQVEVRVRDEDGNWQTEAIHPCRAPPAPLRRNAGLFPCWCDRRVVKLYQRGHGFYRCRRCHNLSYEATASSAGSASSRHSSAAIAGPLPCHAALSRHPSPVHRCSPPSGDVRPSSSRPAHRAVLALTRLFRRLRQ